MLVSYLAVFAILYILLSIEEPVWDFVLARVLHDGHHPLNLEKVMIQLNVMLQLKKAPHAHTNRLD